MKLSQKKTDAYALDLILTQYGDQSADYQNGYLDAMDGLPPSNTGNKEWLAGYADGIFVNKWIDGEINNA